jgi:hypothetical protein
VVVKLNLSAQGIYLINSTLVLVSVGLIVAADSNGSW